MYDFLLREKQTVYTGHYVPTYENNGFIDDNFIGEEFNDDLMYSYLSKRYAQDPLVSVATKDFVPEGFSRLGELDLETGLFCVGRDRCIPTNYEIIPDYVPMETVLDHTKKMIAGSMAKGPYIPVANPIIPRSKLIGYDVEQSLEKSFIKKGFKLFRPGNAVEYRLRRDGFGDKIVARMEDGDKIFDRDGFCKDMILSPDIRWVSLQFNPHNPVSAKLINHLVKESPTLVTGTYKFKDREYEFSYDLESQNYRVHSDNWVRAFNFNNDTVRYYEMFDLIGNYPFLEDFRIYATNTIVNALIVEPYSSTRNPTTGYSHIGPWKGELKIGGVERVFSPYFTPAVHVPRRNKVNLQEVKYSLRKGHYMTENGFRVNFDKRGYPMNKDYYVHRYKDNSLLYLVVRDCDNPDLVGTPVNFKVMGTPVNMTGSIIFDFRSIGLLAMHREMRSGHKVIRSKAEYWGDPFLDESHFDAKNMGTYERIDELEPELEKGFNSLTVTVEPPGDIIEGEVQLGGMKKFNMRYIPPLVQPHKKDVANLFQLELKSRLDSLIDYIDKLEQKNGTANTNAILDKLNSVYEGYVYDGVYKSHVTAIYRIVDSGSKWNQLRDILPPANKGRYKFAEHVVRSRKMYENGRKVKVKEKDKTFTQGNKIVFNRSKV